MTTGNTTTTGAELAPRMAAAALAKGGDIGGSRAVAHYLGAMLAGGVSRSASAGRLDLAALALTVSMAGAAHGADGVNAARHALDDGRAGLEPGGVAGAALAAAWAAAGGREPGSVARVYPWGAVTAADVLTLGAALAAVYAPSTVSAILSGVRSVLRLAVAFGEADTATATAAAAIKRPRDGRTDPAPRRSTAHAGDPATLAALWRAVDADTMPTRRARDRALLALLYGAGLRRSEAAAVTVGDVVADIGGGMVTVERGKGGKARAVPIAAWAAAALAEWRAERRRLELDDAAAAGAFLLSVNRYGRGVPLPLTGHAIGAAVGRVAAAAGVPVVPHDLRRAFVSAAITAGGGDLSAAAYLAGHASVTTTARYDRRQARAAAVIAAAIPAPLG